MFDTIQTCLPGIDYEILEQREHSGGEIEKLNRISDGAIIHRRMMGDFRIKGCPFTYDTIQYLIASTACDTVLVGLAKHKLRMDRSEYSEPELYNKCTLLDLVVM